MAEHIDGPGVVTGKPYIRPRDASTLLILRRDGADTKVLMGKRSAAHKFLPGKYVFPGGRLDLADTRVKPANDLDPSVMRKLLTGMRGKPSKGRARGLGLTAIRETFEETGVVIGEPVRSPPKSRSSEWRQFYSTGYIPVLKPLRLIARAITPPGRPRRFDTRFFVLDATDLDLIETGDESRTDELLEINWLSLSETRETDLPYITGVIIDELEQRLSLTDPWTVKRPIPFFHMEHRRFMRDSI